MRPRGSPPQPAGAHLADQVGDAQRPVYLLQGDAVRVVEQGVQLVQQGPLVALALRGGGRHQQLVQGVPELTPGKRAHRSGYNLVDGLPGGRELREGEISGTLKGKGTLKGN